MSDGSRAAEFDETGDWSFAPEVSKGQLRPPRALEPGQLFAGQYRVAALLGRGGMGAVYRARDERLGRDIALKVLSRSPKGVDLARFRREGEVTATLDHPGIVKVHASGEAAGVPYLAYELVEGGRTLRFALRDLPRPARVKLVLRVAEAVGFAHRRGVAHRDLKPENVLIDLDGRPRVADFGLALGQDDERLTATGATVGTPYYMAPEQFLSRSADTGPPCDVWALGVILYEALTGRLPFDAANLAQLAVQIAASEPDPPRSVDPTVPAQQEAVCLAALAKDMRDRYPDADSLSEDLARALAGASVLAVGGSHRPLRGRRARSLLLLGLGLFALLSGGLWVRSNWGARLHETELRAALAEFRAGQEGYEALEALLLASEGVPDDLEADACLALAAAPAVEPAEWESRLLHARRAAELDPRRSAAAALLEGLALESLGRFAQAAVAYERDPALALQRGAALLAAGSSDSARSLAAELVADDPMDLEALRLQVRAELGCGEVAAARRLWEAYSQLDSGPQATLLEAELRRAGGEDVRSFLRAALRQRPRSGALNAALARELLRRGRPWPAWRAISCDPNPSAALAAVLEALSQDPPSWKPVSRIHGELRDASVRCLLLIAGREVAFLDYGLDPRRRPPPAAALAQSQRLIRASRALAGVLALAHDPGQLARANVLLARLAAPDDPQRGQLAAAALALAPNDATARRLLAEARIHGGQPRRALEQLEGLRDPEAEWLRARALVDVGEPERAAPLLRAALAAKPDDARRVAAVALELSRAGLEPEAEAARARCELLRGSRRAEADAEMLLIGGEADRMDDEARASGAGYARVLKLYPLHPFAFLQRGTHLYLQGDVHQGLARCMVAIARHPSFLPRLYGVFWIMHEAKRDLGGGSAVDVLALFEGSSRRDQQARAFICAVLADIEGRVEWLQPAIEAFDAILAEDPGLAWAYVLRGALEIRAGAYLEAERDLKLAEEAAPDCGGVHFFQALLAATRGDPASGILLELAEAEAALFNFGIGELRVLDCYPAFASYAQRGEFQRFARPR